MTVHTIVERKYQRREAIAKELVINERFLVDDLAGKFNVDRRTIFRDLQALRKEGLRIDGAAGFGCMLRGWYANNSKGNGNIQEDIL